MTHLRPKHMKEMEEFKSSSLANNSHAYGGDLSNIKARDHHHHHHHHHRHPQIRERALEHDPTSKRVVSSTSRTWNNNKSNNTEHYHIQRKASWINGPEVRRQKRVVKYKAYAVEGKMKASFISGCRWVKNKYCQLVHGH